MNNDLISRENLREQFDNYKYFYSSFEKMTVAEFLTIAHELIDNAPTVEQKEFEQILQPIKVNIPDDIKDRLIEELSKPRKVYLDEPKTVTDCIIAYGDGFESARRLFERPQGEWKYICSYANTRLLRYECSKCGRTVDVYKRQELLVKYPFCHCGADMRKGEEE